MPPVAVHSVVSVVDYLILFLLQLLPHLLVLPGKFFYHGCKRLDLYCQRGGVLASNGLHLEH